MATEKRLIDANDVIEEINDAISNIAFTSPYQNDISVMVRGMECVLDIVESASAVDAVEVVRCKDCISYKPYYLPGLHKNDNCGICDRYPFLSEDHKFRTETDFCSYGERKYNENP